MGGKRGFKGKGKIINLMRPRMTVLYNLHEKEKQQTIVSNVPFE